ncbi:hypothetical protein SAMN05216548_114118 [Faunimonas pinastri]|uniref:Uncharacterized protein n=1 Tax=Faunimonas pinastri TaxID=1855383 RepID=A0A1H9MZH2_9HYPH|nr:hypothetical protein [Faunimonas pinastri]SER29058.1 hypothetical protein SAMN05216548_114118 [Faunimonas pinastri]
MRSIIQVAEVLSVISFVAFCLMGAVTLWIQQKAAAAAGAATTSAAGAAASAAAQPTADQHGFAADALQTAVDLVKAIPAAMEAVVKAGPAMAALLASILFLAIAATVAIERQPKLSCSIPAQTGLTLDQNKLKDAVTVICVGVKKS